MIKQIKKPIVLKYEDREINLPNETKENINLFWNKLVKENPNLFNGENHCVESIIEKEDRFEMIVVKTNYATYLYNERIGMPDRKINIMHIWSGILLETKDNYFVLGEMDKTTSVPKCLQVPGGGTSNEDIKDGILEIDINLQRELKEELDLDLNAIKYEINYLECPSEKRRVYGFLATGKLDITKDELNKHFEKYKRYIEKNGLEKEFSKLIFLDKNNALEELDRLNNPKREYLREFIEINMKKI